MDFQFHNYCQDFKTDYQENDNYVILITIYKLHFLYQIFLYFVNLYFSSSILNLISSHPTRMTDSVNNINCS